MVPPARFSEPTAALPLRWWTHSGRSVAGLTLVIAGGLLIVTATGETSWLAWVGSAAHVLGWVILPTSAWRRFWAAGPSLVAVWLLLLGPQLGWLLAAPLALWLLIRVRPSISYVTVALPLAVGGLSAALGGPYAARLPVFLVTFAATVLAAWAGWLLAVWNFGSTKRSISGNSASGP